MCNATSFPASSVVPPRITSLSSSLGSFLLGPKERGGYRRSVLMLMVLASQYMLAKQHAETCRLRSLLQEAGAGAGAGLGQAVSA